jgi:hypothetical protein
MIVRAKTTGAVTAEMIAEVIEAVIAAAVAVGDGVAGGAIAGDVRKVAREEETCRPPNMLRHRAAKRVVTIIAADSAAATTIAAKMRHAVQGLPRRFPLNKKFSFPENHLRSIAANR